MKLDGTGHLHVKRNKPDSETHVTCFFLYAIPILDFLKCRGNRRRHILEEDQREREGRRKWRCKKVMERCL